MSDLDGFLFFSGAFDGGSSNGSGDGNNSNMGCIILVLFLTAVGVFCNWAAIQERWLPNHEDTADSIVEYDSIVWDDGIECDY